jgi:hypothetical protein
VKRQQRDREREYITARHTVKSHSYAQTNALNYTTQSETSEEVVISVIWLQ